MSSTPIVLCARRPDIAKSIANKLLPEYKGDHPMTVHICNTPEQGLAFIPALLGAQQLSSTQVDAVIVGGGFSDADYNVLRLACKNGRIVPWFKADRRNFANMPPLDKPEAFGAQAASRIKAKLAELRVGQVNGASEGEHLF